MDRIRKLLRWFTYRFPRLAYWVLRRPVLATSFATLTVVVLVAAGLLVPPLFARCGEGMTADANDACVGINLDSAQFRQNEPEHMRELEAAVRANNAAITDNYVSVVLFQDMSPNEGVDTRLYPDLYPDIEGAIAGAWRANHTAAFQGSVPKVKLFLANMGSQYASWSEAVDKISEHAAGNHVVSVIGLGQSMDNTRAAAAKLTAQAHLPVIGATVTGDTMNLTPEGKLNTGFFRTSPTNTHSVAAAARFIASIEPDPSRVAIVQDNIPGDDYTQTLGSRAVKEMPAAHRFPFTSPGALPHDVSRADPLLTQFAYLNQNLCSVAPTVVYFTGRGTDLGPFVQSWTQGNTPCANGKLTVVTGDDGGSAINEASLRDAVRGGHVRVLFTSLASPDEWGPCNGSAEQAAYNTFQSVFTGKPGVCDGQTVRADDGAAPLTFSVADLGSGEGILAHDAMMVAVMAARRAANGNADTVVRTPLSQIGLIEEMRCQNAVQGASGTIQFSPDQAQYGNPVEKPFPVVEIRADGSTATAWNKAVTTAVPKTSC
ncbi:MULTISPECIES: ABC transporter substrate-binding protein [Amycolatopsis]|uniref:ABC transporter substrate-binding protein n=1 Tax=Amycolatopsis TaxID=1813 RepID=UPI0010703387|nr:MULTISPECIES: ABC transporter substrate-binding protein [Amycolatopsis]MCG3753580.1 ABC transporter substrate-binding protein [Amycolatopsis sp. Poz14]